MRIQDMDEEQFLSVLNQYQQKKIDELENPNKQKN